MNEPIVIGDAMLYLGDMRVVVPILEAGSVDSVVTDSPYGLGFMGKDWDHGVPGVHFWREILRVAKPGAYLLAFGGTRTYHRLACAIEDAGFEIRDQVQWLYGSGFPKSLNIALEYEQVLCERRPGSDGKKRWYYLGEDVEMARVPPFRYPLASEWVGWGTALKPAHEPIVVARKPLDGTVAANVLAHGTGGLNIEGCRIGTTRGVPASKSAKRKMNFGMGEQPDSAFDPNVGRWPANVVHDGSGEVVGLFPSVSHGHWPSKGGAGGISTSGHRGYTREGNPRKSSGSAARFFYCAKASKADRDEGCEGLEEKRGGEEYRPMDDGCAGLQSRLHGATVKGRNAHPTVKPTALMRWLVRLVTPPGGICLDPFMGSGSTGKACAKEGFRFWGIELDPGYFDIACRRIEDAMTGGPLLAGKPEALSAVEGESP